MRPLAQKRTTCFVPTQSGEVPDQKQPDPSPIHRVRDIDLDKLEKPYTKDQMTEYLAGLLICQTGESAFDDCLFQSVLFTDFFKKVETGKLVPGQPEHDRPARYFLKKSIELVHPLGIKIEETSHRYDRLLLTIPSEQQKDLKEELRFVQGMVARFEALEKNLLDAWANPEGFTPTRDKACFVLFAHAMLSDTVRQMQGLMDALDPAVNRAHVLWHMAFDDEPSLIQSYLIEEKGNWSNLFSPGPLTPADASLYNKCLNPVTELDDVQKSTVPSFSKTGLQGVLAILHGIFNGVGLLSGASAEPLAVHANAYMRFHLSTLRHNCDHVGSMLQDNVLTSTGTAAKLMPIYRKLVDPRGSMPNRQMQRDLVVLFHLLRENNMLTRKLGNWDPSDPLEDLSLGLFMNSRIKSFLDYADWFFQRAFNVADMVTLLNAVGFSITPIDERSTDEENENCSRAVIRDMNILWMDFRERHAEDLKSSRLFAELPKFLAD